MVVHDPLQVGELSSTLGEIVERSPVGRTTTTEAELVSASNTSILEDGQPTGPSKDSPGKGRTGSIRLRPGPKEDLSAANQTQRSELSVTSVTVAFLGSFFGGVLGGNLQSTSQSRCFLFFYFQSEIEIVFPCCLIANLHSLYQQNLLIYKDFGVVDKKLEML